MNKLWQVATFEYKRNVFKKSFIFTLLSVPLLIGLIIGIGLFVESSNVDTNMVGYVDDAGVINETGLSPELSAIWVSSYSDPVEFVAYATEDQAQDALKSKKIQAYYLLPEDYFASRRVFQRYIERPGENAERQFFDYLQLNLVNNQPQEIAVRVALGTKAVVRSLDGSRFIPESGPTFGLLMPLFINLAFLGLMLLSSGYTMTAVAEEKENRTMEILITTISPSELVGGKILGIVAISLTMLITWTGVVLTGVFIASRMGISWFGDLSMDWRIILATLAIAIPAYVLVTALMVAIGSVVSSEKEGQSISSIFIILHLVPLYISLLFLKQPHSILAIILSLMPFTGLMTIGMRNLFSIVPTWQVLVSMIVQILSAFGAISFAIWAFRYGMLQYGQRLKFGKLVRMKRRGSS
jgi:ABC-2 type transport system permease protein